MIREMLAIGRSAILSPLSPPCDSNFEYEHEESLFGCGVDDESGLMRLVDEARWLVGREIYLCCVSGNVRDLESIW